MQGISACSNCITWSRLAPTDRWSEIDVVQTNETIYHTIIRLPGGFDGVPYSQWLLTLKNMARNRAQYCSCCEALWQNPPEVRRRYAHWLLSGAMLHFLFSSVNWLQLSKINSCTMVITIISCEPTLLILLQLTTLMLSFSESSNRNSSLLSRSATVLEI